MEKSAVVIGIRVASGRGAPVRSAKRSYSLKTYLTLGMVVLAIVPLLFNGYFTLKYTQARLEKEKTEKLAAFAMSVEARLPQALAGITPASGGKDGLQSLHRVFQPLLDEAARNQPEVALGLYLKEAAAVVAWTPYDPQKIGWSPEPASPQLQVYQTGKAFGYVSSGSWDRVITYVSPVILNGKVIGHIVASDPILPGEADVRPFYSDEAAMVGGSLVLALLLALALSRLFYRRLRQVEEAINAGTAQAAASRVGEEFQGIVDLLNDIADRTFAEKSFFTTVLDNLPVGIIAADQDGKFNFVNLKTGLLLGYEPWELLGLTFGDFYLLCQPEPFEPERQVYNEWVQGKPFGGYQMSILRQDRSRTAVEVSVYPLHDKNGQLAGSLALMRDLSLELDYGALQNRSQSTLECLQSGVIAIDKDFKIMIFNPAAEGLFEERASDVLGQDVSKVFPQRLGRRSLVETLLSGEAVTNYQVSVEINGTTKSLLTNTALVRDKRGQVVGAVAVFMDVTELRYYEEKVKVQEKLAVVGQMAAGMAHELRNPLTAVRGFIQLTKEKMQGDEKSREHFELIMQEIDRTNKIINDFLILAKPKPPKLSIQPFNELLKSLLPLFESQCLMYNIQIRKSLAPSLPPVVVDADQIKQVILNLVQNAIQAMSHAGGELSLATRYEAAEGMLVMAVTDTGVGISPADLNKLGTPFYTTKDHGTGLGLSVSYRIAEAHRGNIKVQSKQGEGSTFEICLPAGYM